MADKQYRALQDAVKVLVDREDGTYAERVEAYPPKVLMTDQDGLNARLRVEPARSSFFMGQQFRMFAEFSVTSSAPWTFKMVRPINCIVFGLELTANNGKIRLDAYTGGTESGIWTASVNVLPQNQMTSRPFPYYVPQAVISAGGTVTGGVLWDSIVLNGTTVPSKVTTIGAVASDERGLPGGTTGYYVISTTDAGPITGKIQYRWEEEPL